MIDHRRSHWVARGPANVRVSWDAEIINELPPHLIAWRSLPGADVASAGSVRFVRQMRGGTVVTVTLQYDPPAGKLGGWIAWLSGSSPEAQLREGLQAFKQMAETGGRPDADGRPSPERERSSRITDSAW